MAEPQTKPKPDAVQRAISIFRKNRGMLRMSQAVKERPFGSRIARKAILTSVPLKVR
jgi:hypothetical protein